MSTRDRVWFALLLLCLVGVSIAAFYSMRREKGVRLHSAVIYGRLEEVRAIIDDGVDIDYRLEGKTPLLVAALDGHREIVDLLLEAGADPNAPGDETPLLVAAVGGHGEIVDILLEAGADPNATVWGGVPLLDMVAAGAPSEIFFRFFGEDRDLNPDALVWGDTILSWRLLRGVGGYNENRDVIHFLIAEGADVNLDGVGSLGPCIHLAIDYWDFETVRLLCEAGADVNVSDAIGRYPLHSAVDEGLDKVKVLLEHGADRDLVNRFGQTPLEAARIALDLEFDAETQEIVNYRESLNEVVAYLESLNATD